MKKLATIIVFFTLFICLGGGMSGCAQKKKSRELPKPAGEAETSVAPTAPSATTKLGQLPSRYQSPGFVLPKDKLDDTLAGVNLEAPQMKVGATIRSTNGPQPLWDVMKRLANLKGMTVSWSSDVDQNAVVDVDIAANDNFYDAVANLLRQADYFHEINGNNLVIRNKTTKVFKMAVPFMRGAYTTNVGGNFLSNKEGTTGTEGTVKIASADNKFDVWDNIDTNLKSILKISSAERKDITSSGETDKQKDDGKKTPDKDKKISGKDNSIPSENGDVYSPQVARYSDKDEPYFVIDKNIGLITVTAKPALLNTVEKYLDNLKKHLFQQVNIEAKIVEVFLQDNSRIGLDWTSIFKDNVNNPISGTISFGNSGQVYPQANGFVRSINLNSFNFTALLNALKEQGDTHVLANPKITVLNGQPAVISVGTDVAYVKSVKRDETDSGTGGPRVTYTAEVGNVVQGIALGVMASVVDQDKVILHLTPITTDINNLQSDGSVAVTTIGGGAIMLSLPQVKVREMSTMVEVKNGEMLVIGGLIDNVQSNTGDFIPGLGSIPVIKYLFGVEDKQMRKRELVILLTPQII
ncbi:MAG: pilus (MSHA type) biogenesis protein MshL [Desulfobulbus sp.]|nr:pilus (MSHA type) biogenesis protein MshL [Desulfobulbus sp.]